VAEYNVLIERAQAACRAGRDKVRAAINLAVDQGELASMRTKGQRPKTLYGTPSQLTEYMNPKMKI